MATAEEAATWIALESDDYDGMGGAKGFGWARASTEDVARGLHIGPQEAFRLLKAAKRKKLVTQVEGMRKKLGRDSGRHSEREVGWALWEAHLDREQTIEREGSARPPDEKSIAFHKHDPALDDIARGDQVTGRMLLRAAETAGLAVDPKLERLLDKASVWVRPRLSNLSTDAANRQAVDLYSQIGRARDPEHPKFTPNSSRGEAEERDRKALARKRIPWTSDHPDARAYRRRYGFTNTLPVRNDQDYLSEKELEGRRFGMEPNASYYVWVLAPGSDAPLSSEGPYGPHPLKTAEQMARIGAQEGVHDRAVSVGQDPESRTFQILRRYAAGTGERIA